MFILKWIGYTLAVMFIAWIIPGISVGGFVSALIVAMVLGLINIIIKPVVMFISLPFNVITLGLFTLVINALLMMLAGAITPGFQVSGFWSAFFGALILSLITTALNYLLKSGDQE